MYLAPIDLAIAATSVVGPARRDVPVSSTALVQFDFAPPIDNASILICQYLHSHISFVT